MPDIRSLSCRLNANADLQDAWAKWELGDTPIPEPLFAKDTATLLREASASLDSMLAACGKAHKQDRADLDAIDALESVVGTPTT